MSGNPNIFDIRDIITGDSLLAVHRASNTNTQWSYNGEVVIADGLPLISGSIGVTPSEATVFTVTLQSGMLKIESTYQTGVPTTVAIANVDVTGRVYDLYISNGVDTSSLGTVSAIGITGMFLRWC